MSAKLSAATLPALPDALAALDPMAGPAHWLSVLVLSGQDQLPAPGSGATLQRWQALAAVAEHDLSLAKLFEGHTDALAILAELQPDPEPRQGLLWGVWAAEAPGARVLISPDRGERVVLNGVKCWCSGAAELSQGLMTAWHADGRGPQLVRVATAQAGVSVRASAWHAVGMAGSKSLDLAFAGAQAEQVGAVGAYLSRPGFWQGGAGIAACWYGGAVGLARALRRSLTAADAAGNGLFRLCALGKVDMALQATAATLRDAAHWIDSHPTADASRPALRVRLLAEATAKRVLDEVGAALGATPFCRDARFARAAADLPVFIRQSHGERDFAALGERVLALEQAPAWRL